MLVASRVVEVGQVITTSAVDVYFSKVIKYQIGSRDLKCIVKATGEKKVVASGADNINCISAAARSNKREVKSRYCTSIAPVGKRR